MRRVVAELAAVLVVLVLWYTQRPETPGVAVIASFLVLIRFAFANRMVPTVPRRRAPRLDANLLPTGSAPAEVNHLSIAAAFLILGLGFSVPGMNQPWLLVVLVCTAGLYAASAAAVARFFTSNTAIHYGHAITAVATTAWLYCVGSLFQIRIDLDPNPNQLGGFWLGTSADLGTSARLAELFGQAWRLLAVPGITLLVLAAVAVVSWLRKRQSGAVRSPSLRMPPTTSFVLFVVLGIVTAVLYLIPMLDAPVNGAYLSFYGVATPELAKVLWVGLVAFAIIFPTWQVSHRVLVIPRPSMLWHRIRGTQPATTVPYMMRISYSPRDIWLIVLVLFGLGQAVLRSDIGSTVPLLGAAAAMYAATSHRYRYHLAGSTRSADPDAPKPRRSMAQAFREQWISNRSLRTIVVLAVAVSGAMIALVLVSGYQAERLRVVQDPFAYENPAPCTSINDPALGLTDGQKQQIINDVGQRVAYAANTLNVDVPETIDETWQQDMNSDLCVTNRLGRQREQYAQVGIGLAIMNAGGLWGQGMEDTSARRVPAVTTDFAINAFVSKFGLAAGAAVTLATVLLAFVLVRLPRNGFQGLGAQSLPYAFAAGIAGGLFFTGLFVWLAVTAIVPHSGVPFPFLSVGAHSNTAWVVAVAALLVLARATDRQHRHRSGSDLVVDHQLSADITAEPAGSNQRSRAIYWWVAAAMAAILPIAGIQLMPRDGVSDATEKLRLADQSRETVVELSTGERLTPPTSQDDSAADQPAEYLDYLKGLVRQTADQQPALLDQAVAGDTTEVLSPSQDGTNVVKTTLDAELQKALVTEVRRQDAKQLMPQAAVVMDAITGDVLAAASTPELPDSQVRVQDSAAIRKYLNAERDYWSAVAGAAGLATGPMRWGPGETDESPLLHEPTRYCTTNGSWECWRVQLTPGGPSVGDKRYVAGRDDVPAPDPGIHRVFQEYFGPGSTFKVVAAIAHLRQGGSLSDSVYAPSTLTLPSGRVVKNHDGQSCGSSSQVTIADALAMSCNTAFVTLGQDLGWPTIKQTAMLLGFEVADDSAPGQYIHQIAPRSLVPEKATSEYIVNAVLGGGQVRATPAAMAAVIGVAANGGRYQDPQLLADSTSQYSRRVLKPEQAAELWDALRGAVTHGRGTLRGVDAPDGVEFAGKSGTHVLNDGVDNNPAGEFWTHNLWIAGAAKLGDRSVVVVSAVAGTNPTAGKERNAEVVEAVLEEWGSRP